DQEREAQRELGLGGAERVDERCRAPAKREHEHRRQRHQDEREQEQHDQSHRYGGAPSGGSDGVGSRAHFLGGSFTTLCFQIFSTISFLARRQPPKSAIRNASSMRPNSAWPVFRS